MSELRTVRWQTFVAAPACGFVAGFGAGVWLRIVMRIVALTAGTSVAEIAIGRNGTLVPATIPRFTLDGTIEVVLFPAVTGAFLGLLLLVVRALFPLSRAAGGLALGALLLVFPGSLILASTPEFGIGHRWLGTSLGAVTPLVYGTVFERLLGLTERDDTPDETASYWRDR